jgi:plasmid stability protein
MKSTATKHASETEVRILARILANEEGRLPLSLARYLLNLGFSDEDKARMHDLAVRNQDDGLASTEKEELYAYAKAGSLLSILKSNARRTLKIRPKRRNNS